MAVGAATLLFGDGHYPFRIWLGEARELEAKRDCGLFELVARIDSGRWRVDDIREAIRIGLIGGGMKPLDALRLVTRYIDEAPPEQGFADWLPVARAALLTFMFGLKSSKKKPGAKRATMDASTSSDSTGMPAPSGSAAQESSTP